MLSPVLPEGETDPVFLVPYNHLAHWDGAQELRIQTPDCSLQFRQELLENALPKLWSLGLDVELSVPSMCPPVGYPGRERKRLSNKGLEVNLQSCLSLLWCRCFKRG